MKKFFLSVSALLIANLNADAQAWVTITNRTNCNVEVTVIAREAAGPCNPITATPTTPGSTWVIPANNFVQFENLDPAVVDFTVDVLMDPAPSTFFPYSFSAATGFLFRVNHTTWAPSCSYPVGYTVPSGGGHGCSGGWGWSITHNTTAWPSVEYFIDPI